MAREATDICLWVLKESNKSRFDSYSVRNSVFSISRITFRDCRVHILSDNLSRNSCINRRFRASATQASVTGVFTIFNETIMHLVYPPKLCTTIVLDFVWDDCHNYVNFGGIQSALWSQWKWSMRYFGHKCWRSPRGRKTRGLVLRVIVYSHSPFVSKRGNLIPSVSLTFLPRLWSPSWLVPWREWSLLLEHEGQSKEPFTTLFWKDILS